MHRTRLNVIGRILTTGTLASALLLPACAQRLGVFDGQQDIGTVLHQGAGSVDASGGKYTLSGSGENMWFGTDDFHFAWKRLSGDVALTADIDFVGTSGNNHRKAALMVRQSLDQGSPYVDVARHGDGLTSLQYRQTAGADTHEVQSAVSAPHRVRIEKRGNFASVWIAADGGPLVFSGATIPIILKDSFYVGLGVCSHDKDVTETVIFSNVRIEPLMPQTDGRSLWSTLETVKVASTDRLVAYTAPKRLDPPVWASDGSSLLFGEAGLPKQVSLKTGSTTVVSARSSPAAGGGAVPSPDGKLSASVAASRAEWSSTGYLMELRMTSFANGKERILAQFWSPDGKLYAPGWSPDSSRIAFVSFATIVPGIAP